MKKILLLLFLVLFVPNLPARELKKEWREYERIARKQRPRDQIAKLHEIREIALDRKLPDDLLEACRREELIYYHMNWKSEDSLRTALLEVVESYGEPLLAFRWLKNDWEYAKAHREELSARRTPALQDYRVPFLQTRDMDDIPDDFEWILWRRVTQFTGLAVSSEEFRLLSEKVGDRYPARPYLEYQMALRSEDCLSAMQALAERYAGDPFRYLPGKKILDLRLDRLLKNKYATEAEAKTLFEDAEAFTRDAKAVKGAYRGIDLSMDELRRSLRASRLWIAFQNDSIVLTGRNFGHGTLTFQSDETHKKVSFLNKDGRFYAMDTVKVPLPSLPDGFYTVTSEGYTRVSYKKHTLSMAVRRQGDDIAVYVTDYLTGEPVPSATFILKHGRKTLQREISLNGFTPLPADFQKIIGKKTATLEARFGERRSPTLSIYKMSKSTETPPATLHGRVFLERGAYRPGDTLKGKAVLFKGDLNKRVNTVGKGEDVRIHIYNAEGRTMTDIDLKTNAFGAVAWEWPIPLGERNGIFGIYVYYDDSNVTHSSFQVDDFVLPTFELTFDPQEEPYFPDTDFVITGKVASFSGHPVDGISLEGTVVRNSREEWKGQVAVGDDGTFRVPLRLPGRGAYRLVLQAVDATGESQKFEYLFEVSSNLSLSVTLENAAKGDFSFRSAKLEKEVLAEPVARFAWTVKNGNQPVKLPVVYKLLDLDGKTVREGKADEMLELDLSDCPDGLYFLQGTVETGKYLAVSGLTVLKMTSGLDAPVRSVFLPGETEIEYGDRILARLGAGNGPLWAVATLFAPDGSVLESRLVHLDGDGTMMDLPFIYKGTYPDAVRLEVFYFRDAEQVFHEAVYHRVRHEMDLPLSFSRFEDRTMPGAPITLTLQTGPGVEAALSVFDKSLDAMKPNRWEAVELLSPTFRIAWSRSLAGYISGEMRNNAYTGSGTVNGEVIDPDGQTIIGASVIVVGSQNGTVTDMDGRFTLDIPAGTLLEISCIGYGTEYVSAYAGMQVVLKEDVEYLEETVVIGYGVSGRPSLAGKLAGVVRGIRIRGVSEPEYEPALYGYRAPESGDDHVIMPDIPEETYREIFSEALAFEPFLYPDETGKADVSFRASDKLSSYHVNVFAHDATMRNAVLQRDFVVTIPVRISVTPPRYLYENDEYELSAVVSSISDEPISGRLYLQVNEGEEMQSVQVADLTVPAGGSAAAVYSVAAPFPDGQALDLKLVFESDTFSDAVRQSVPVFRAAQTLTEAHSALAGPEAADSLRRMFVNIPGEQAEVAVRTLREVVEAGLAEWTAPEDPDAVSLSADFYARSLLGQDTTGTLAPLLALRCEDGGFAWTEGMESSPIVTATLLERFAVLRDKGLPIPDMEAAVHYLDRSQFGNWFPMWCGGLSDEQYMDIRAMWASVPFDLTGVDEKSVRRFRLREFRRFARAYLTPGRYDYTNGWILDKARRVRTLQNLTASEEGLALGKAWGEQILTASRFQKTIANDLESLRQYAVRHPSGALYYPNAVLPFRGLLSSEVYAHTLVASLLEGPVSDGVKLWLVIQNETQSWTGDPAFVDALQAVQTASDSLLDRQIVTLTASADLPFERIKASGNGMRVERKFYLEKDGIRTEVKSGDPLRVGDLLIARYELWSAENRSFVRVDAFREANLLPVGQQSGPARIALDPIRVDGVWTRIAQCYRDIRVDKTSWWIDVCPEESSAWEEELFVTQAGTFTAPVITVESLYAPGYRANGVFQGPLKAE